ncbi:hypothetical protein G6O69_21335 [Pseudenhygromyxa sp. WMMC2535]|uniref:hypothetical protein n=1 Tax=Pseudenhygromyxa sp. WMMC2535 TaxID=2712867 RepID=UPI001553ABB6|nr:hypothetical protein [Pseudenhygromyxa sp. WMMC2535]NVB40397.1 hypothetical protein [Pseudenhygromyxa sp. WMMC2535]
MSARRRITALAFTTTLVVSLLSPLPAAADSQGETGTIDSVEVYSPSSDDYAKYHGRLFVTGARGQAEYRWGGTTCGSKTITDAMATQLVVALDAENTQIVPRFKSGQGGKRCLVGFQLEREDSSKGKSKDKGKGKVK